MKQREFITHQTELSANIVAFCRFLRHKGFTISPVEQADVLSALELLPLDNAQTFRLTLSAVLTKNSSDLKRFDELYREYWENLAHAVDSKVKTGDQPEKNTSENSPKEGTPSIQVIRNWLHGNKAEEETEMAAYSPAEVLTQKDFRAFSKDELGEVMKIITVIARSLATRYNRRFKRGRQTGEFDLRRTLRLNMRRGGEIMELAFRERRVRQLKLVMLCDVSKSMDLYSRFLIQFIYAFQSVYRKIETFVFSTALKRITALLQTGNYAEALQRLAEQIPEWSGGTKIGACLQAFLEDYGQKMLDDRTVVLILSDGWDTGDIEVLEQSMQKIHQKAARVIWLNPLAGGTEYQPTVRGMQAALPYIDIFAPAHNVESLKALTGFLRSHKGKKRYPGLRIATEKSQRIIH